jgi:hypothetical protein
VTTKINGHEQCWNMYGENRANRLKIQRLKSRGKTRDIYKVIGCLMPYRLCALTSAQLKLSSVRFMQQTRSFTITSTRYYRKASSYLRLSRDLREHPRTRNHRRYKTTSIPMTQAQTNLSKYRWNHMLMDLHYDSHLSQLEAGSNRGPRGRSNPNTSKSRKRSSTSS